MPIVRLPVPGEVPVAMLAETEVPLPAGDSAVIGTSTYAARADHVHPKQEIDISNKLGILNPQPPGAADPGMSLFAAREDHVHEAQVIPDVPTISEEVMVASTKPVTVFDDFIPLIDSQDSNSLKRVKIINFVRQRLYSNLNLYVRKDGNDSNTGFTNTSTGAFLTIQAAINKSSWYDYSGFNITINVADGTYVETLTVYPGMQVGLGTLFILGNTTSPVNVQIRNNTPAATINIKNQARVGFMGVFLANDSTGHVIFVDHGGTIDIANMSFGIAGSSAQAIHILSRGFVNISGNYTINNGALRHYHTDLGGVIYINGVTITCSGSYSGQFAFTDMNGTIYVGGATFTGSTTGQRYYAQGGGVIQTYTGNVNLFPGTVAGSLGVGGYYG